MTPEAFEPTAVRYIKLGPGSAWARQAIRDGIIPLGFPEADHEACATGDWQSVARQLKGAGRGSQPAAEDLRELRAFYEADADTLWVTFAEGHLWWTFAEGPVRPVDALTPEGRIRSSMEQKMSFPVGLPYPAASRPVEAPVADGPRRFRPTRDGWHRESLMGEPLAVKTLSSVLTKTANYRRTICRIPAVAYLLRRIRGEANPMHEEAVTLKSQMHDLARRMIGELHWNEFETLVDLIFARGGWRRMSTLGKTMPDVDLILDQPVTGETAWVQVKSRAGQVELNEYLDRFERNGDCDRFFFVCHSAAGAIELDAGPGRHLWTGPEVADRAIDVGLFDWLIERTR